jgi:protein-tyrosine phosphatase
MIDLHCHMLPAVDDGPATIEEALGIAASQVACGVQIVACTPHVSWRYLNTAGSIDRSVSQLREALRQAGSSIDIVSGAEISLTVALEMPDDELSRLTLGSGPWLLVEAPHELSSGVEQAVGSLLIRGHRVLLAHPERCVAFQNDPHALTRLVSNGVLCQLTASALTGAFGSRVARFSSSLIEQRLIHVVASDAHAMTYRAPGLLEPVVNAGFERFMEYLSTDAPHAILSGDELPAMPAVAAPMTWKRRWLRRQSNS